MRLFRITSRYLGGLTVPVRPVDVGPGADIPRRDVVSSPSVAAFHTDEHVATATVRPRDVPAERAHLTGVPGIDENDWHSGQSLQSVQLTQEKTHERKLSHNHVVLNLWSWRWS